MIPSRFPLTTQTQLSLFLDAVRLARLGEPFLHVLRECLQFASITELEDRPDRAAAVRINKRTPRVMDDVAVPLLFSFSLFRSTPHFNYNCSLSMPEAEQKHYICAPRYDGVRVPFHRAMAGALAGEQVLLPAHDHRDLRPSAGLCIARTPERGMRDTTDARSRALAIALASYDKYAVKLGLADMLTRDQYREVILSCYGLCDARFGHILRPPFPVAAE